VLEAPLTARVSLATEVSHDDERSSLWLAVRINFKAPMPWRPVRGALSGRVRESSGGAPVAGVRLALDGRAGLTDADGGFTLPGRVPGTYPLTWSLPPEFLAAPNWPSTVDLRAGELQVVELVAQRITLLHGTVEIVRGIEREHPTGTVSATESSGQIFETVAAAGEFRLLLAPGHYTVRYTGPVAEGVAAQLVATVEIGAKGESATVRLAAEEKVRGLRRTYFRDDDAPAPKAGGI
jgi:hypothetical protein